MRTTRRRTRPRRTRWLPSGSGATRDALCRLRSPLGSNYGCIFPIGTKPYDAASKNGQTASMFSGEWFAIQVKQKDRVACPDIDALKAMMIREDRQKGFFVAFDYTHDALHEIDAFFRKHKKVIVALTVREILNEEIAKKLA
jgi:hypothetical protein